MRLIVNSKYEPVDKIAITQICNNPKPENRFCVNAPCILSIFIYFLYFFFCFCLFGVFIFSRRDVEICLSRRRFFFFFCWWRLNKYVCLLSISHTKVVHTNLHKFVECWFFFAYEIRLVPLAFGGREV